ncbi:hypothetical protein [Streptacidiphilus monticola]|uniref:DUF3039 domain-containing protein n=1 Tax=Streptacidiphilus monticola TaxID=2161674 RepID=A0ABW1FXE9_9ACTN
MTDRNWLKLEMRTAGDDQPGADQWHVVPEGGTQALCGLSVAGYHGIRPAEGEADVPAGNRCPDCWNRLEQSPS